MFSSAVGTLMLLLIPFASFCGPAVTVTATSDNRMMLQLHANTATVVPAAIVNVLTLMPCRLCCTVYPLLSGAANAAFLRFTAAAEDANAGAVAATATAATAEQMEVLFSCCRLGCSCCCRGC